MVDKRSWTYQVFRWFVGTIVVFWSMVGIATLWGIGLGLSYVFPISETTGLIMAFLLIPGSWLVGYLLDV